VDEANEAPGRSGNDEARGVTVDGSGNIYIVGETESDLDGNANAGAGTYDILLVKYSPDGVKQ